jgi:hypothetical protein
MNKAEREDKKELPKNEESQPMRRKSLRKEKPTAKNGSKLSETMLQNSARRANKKVSN